MKIRLQIVKFYGNFRIASLVGSLSELTLGEQLDFFKFLCKIQTQYSEIFFYVISILLESLPKRHNGHDRLITEIPGSNDENY